MRRIGLIAIVVPLLLGGCQKYLDDVYTRQAYEQKERSTLIAKLMALPRSEIMECQLQGQTAPRSSSDPLPTLWSSGHGDTVTDLCLRMKIAKADEAKAAEEAKHAKGRKPRAGIPTTSGPSDYDPQGRLCTSATC